MDIRRLFSQSALRRVSNSGRAVPAAYTQRSRNIVLDRMARNRLYATLRHSATWIGTWPVGDNGGRKEHWRRGGHTYKVYITRSGQVLRVTAKLDRRQAS